MTTLPMHTNTNRPADHRTPARNKFNDLPTNTHRPAGLPGMPTNTAKNIEGLRAAHAKIRAAAQQKLVEKKSALKPSPDAVNTLVFIVEALDRHGKLLYASKEVVSSSKLSDALAKDISFANSMGKSLMSLEPRKNGDDVIEVISPATQVANSVVADAVVSAKDAADVAVVEAKEVVAPPNVTPLLERAASSQGYSPIILNNNLALIEKFADIAAAIVGLPSIHEMVVGKVPSSRNMPVREAEARVKHASSNISHAKYNCAKRLEAIYRQALSVNAQSRDALGELLKRPKTAENARCIQYIQSSLSLSQMVVSEIQRAATMLAECSNAVIRQLKSVRSASKSPALSSKDSVKVKGAHVASAEIIRKADETSNKAAATLDKAKHAAASAKPGLPRLPALPSVTAQRKPVVSNVQAQLNTVDNHIRSIKAQHAAGKISTASATAALEKASALKAKLENMLGKASAVNVGR